MPFVGNLAFLQKWKKIHYGRLGTKKNTAVDEIRRSENEAIVIRQLLMNKKRQTRYHYIQGAMVIFEKLIVLEHFSKLVDFVSKNKNKM
jgi:hypothetical protein